MPHWLCSFASVQPVPLATCLRHALRYPNIDEHLRELAGGATQPAVRAVAYQCLLTDKATWPAGYEWIWIDKIYGLRRRVIKMDLRDTAHALPQAELIRDAMRDKSPKVRIVAADALIDLRTRLADADGLIEQLAKDRSPAVRWRADYMLRHPTTSLTDGRHSGRRAQHGDPEFGACLTRAHHIEIPGSRVSRAPRNDDYRIVGIVNSAPSLVPEGQREVTVLVLV